VRILEKDSGDAPQFVPFVKETRRMFEIDEVSADRTRHEAGFFLCAVQWYNSRMRLPRRRTIWFIAALLLAVVVGAWCFMPRSRITQVNFDSIYDGMDEAYVAAILGDADQISYHPRVVDLQIHDWRNGASFIRVTFRDRKVKDKRIHRAGAWETFTWCAKKGAAKLGVKWN